MVSVVYNGTMISVARITMCKPVAATHCRGLLRRVVVVPVASNAFRKTSFGLVGDTRTGRAGFPAKPFRAGSNRCIGWVVIVLPLLQLQKHMLDVKPPGYKLRAFLGHSPQQPFPAFVDERDVIEVDNAGSLVRALVRPLPGCSQLADPRPDQASLHDPYPICCRLHDGDLQHVYLSGPPRGCVCVSARGAPRSRLFNGSRPHPQPRASQSP